MTVSTHGAPRGWVDEAIRLLQADTRRSADTHLLRYPLPSAWSEKFDVALYLKDESTHITGSLKHRLARATSACEADKKHYRGPFLAWFVGEEKAIK